MKWLKKDVYAWHFGQYGKEVVQIVNRNPMPGLDYVDVRQLGNTHSIRVKRYELSCLWLQYGDRGNYTDGIISVAGFTNDRKSGNLLVIIKVEGYMTTLNIEIEKMAEKFIFL